MATPSTHAAAVTDFILREANPSLVAPLDDDYLAAEVHAMLSMAAGSGETYTAADTMLSSAESKPIGSRRRPLMLARLLALRADR